MIVFSMKNAENKSDQSIRAIPGRIEPMAFCDVVPPSLRAIFFHKSAENASSLENKLSDNLILLLIFIG